MVRFSSLGANRRRRFEGSSATLNAKATKYTLKFVKAYIEMDNGFITEAKETSYKI